MDSRIAYRLEDYFRRQQAWFHEALAGLDEYENTAKGGQLDGLVRERLSNEKKTRALGEEFESLSREWHNTEDVPEADRERIRQLAAETGELAEALKAKLENTSLALSTQSNELLTAFEDVRKGRDMLKKYKAGGGDAPSFMDRKA